jgi:hypothetical protein
MTIPKSEAASQLDRTRTRRKFMTVDEVVSTTLDEHIKVHAASGWVGVPLSRCQMLRALVARGALCLCSLGRNLVVLPTPERSRRRRLVEVDRFVLDVLDEQIEKHELTGVRTRMRRCQMMRRLVLRAVRCTCLSE